MNNNEKERGDNNNERNHLKVCRKNFFSLDYKEQHLDDAAAVDFESITTTTTTIIITITTTTITTAVTTITITTATTTPLFAAKFKLIISLEGEKKGRRKGKEEGK
ncbi:hypothetical protein LOAG_11793 [Loa loa]|uniref:Uncharacterized protein n=1 Tax=Loa loa TaxID=7209 RepID=A0A1S0TMG2_LOALO|nr:hypothetical protein LOAG_11793 [Loa loa]EFO16711.1 hypothetical protein LOAG_11793 [Loa loa]